MEKSDIQKLLETFRISSCKVIESKEYCSVPITDDIYLKCLKFIDDIGHKFFKVMTPEDIFNTSWGTVVFEWVDGMGKEIAIEIGVESLCGYTMFNGTCDKYCSNYQSGIYKSQINKIREDIQK